MFFVLGAYGAAVTLISGEKELLLFQRIIEEVGSTVPNLPGIFCSIGFSIYYKWFAIRFTSLHSKKCNTFDAALSE